jgi:hypothetical protein
MRLIDDRNVEVFAPARTPGIAFEFRNRCEPRHYITFAESAYTNTVTNCASGIPATT